MSRVFIIILCKSLCKRILHVCTCQYFENYHVRNIQFAASPLYWSRLFSTTVLRVGWEVAKAKTKKQDDTKIARIWSGYDVHMYPN